MASGRVILLELLGLVVAEAAVSLLSHGHLGCWSLCLRCLQLPSATFVVQAAMGKRLAGRSADMLSRRDVRPDLLLLFSAVQKVEIESADRARRPRQAAGRSASAADGTTPVTRTLLTT
jgi:hypothetical protein